MTDNPDTKIKFISKIYSFIKKHIRWLFLIFGFTILLLILKNLDWELLGSTLKQITVAGAFLVLIPHFAAFLLDNLIIQKIFARLNVKFRYSLLFFIRISAEPIQLLLPGGQFTAEPTRIIMCKNYGIPVEKSTGGFVLTRIILSVSSIMFGIAGLIGCVIYFGFFNRSSLMETYSSSPATLVASVTMAIVVLGVFILFAFVTVRQSIKQGLFVFLTRILGKLPFLRNTFEKHKETIIKIDTVIKEFYTKTGKPYLILRYAFYFFITWIVDAFEVYVILQVIGIDIPVFIAILIHSFGSLVRTGAKVVPAGIGAQEGGYVLLFMLFLGPFLKIPEGSQVMDYTIAVAASFSILLRGVEISWIVSGLIFFWVYSIRKKKIIESKSGE